MLLCKERLARRRVLYGTGSGSVRQKGVHPRHVPFLHGSQTGRFGMRRQLVHFLHPRHGHAGFQPRETDADERSGIETTVVVPTGRVDGTA